MAAATCLDKTPNIVIAAIDTDGTDGPTDMAGGIVDCTTMERARELGVDIFNYMERFNSTVALKILGDVIYTGATGTNVNDLRIVAVV